MSGEQRNGSLLDLEHRILGILIQEPKRLGAAGALISEEDFTEGRRRIYETLRRLFLEGSPIDALILTQAMGGDQGDGTLQTYLEGLAAQSCDPGKLSGYCVQLHDATRLEQARRAATQLIYAESIDDLAPAMEKLNSLMISGQRMQVTRAADAAMRFLDRMNAKAPDYLDWGLPSLTALSYTEPGDFIALGGYPSAGKTALAAQIALHISRKLRVGFFSLETGETKLTDRMISSLSGVPLGQIKKRDFMKKDWEALSDASRELFARRLEIVDAAGATVADIQARSLAERYQVIFVDYLQLIAAAGSSRYEKVTEISMQLHTLARTHKITVVALAQLQRPEKNREGKLTPPSMSSFKESGQIEQDADLGLILYPEDPNDYKSRRKLKIAKNKEDRHDVITLDFDGPTQRFSEAVEDYVPRPKEKKSSKKKPGYSAENEELPL